MSTISTDESANAAKPSASLSINDIQNLLIVIDLASQRGAFRATELSQIGQLFDKVNQFLSAATPATEQKDNTSQLNTPNFQKPTVSPMPMPMPVSTPSPVSPMAPPFVPKIGA